MPPHLQNPCQTTNWQFVRKIKSKEQRTKNKEQKIKNKEPRIKSQEKRQKKVQKLSNRKYYSKSLS